MFRLKPLLHLAILALCVLAAGCRSAPKSGADDHFRVNLGVEPPSLDWSKAVDHVSFNVISNLMVGLAEFDKDLKPAPVIAKSWDVLEGGSKLVFHLRDDVLWSDGKKVRAQDFEYSWKRLLDPKTAAEYAYILFDIVNAEAFNQGKAEAGAVGVRATDDVTLEVQLRHPASYFLAITTFEVTFPQRQDVIDKHGPRWTDPGNMVANGPFTLASWKHENEIELSANGKFFSGKPAMQRVTMVMVNEKTTALAMYEQENLDFIDNHSIPALEKPKLASKPGFKRVPQLRGYYYGFITDRKPFDDARVRRAFSLAVDRGVFPAILRGGEIPATSWIPPGMAAHNDKIGLGFDPAAAKKLMREAGFPDGQGFPPVVLAYNTEEDHKLVAEAVQGMWQKHLGVIVKLENQEWKVYLKKLQNDPPNIFRMGWGADYPDPDNFMKLFTANSGNNHTRWKSAKFDQLLEQAARELDTDKRSKLYDAAQKILIEDDAVIMPFFWTAETTLLNPKFAGLEFNSMARMDLRNVRRVKK